MTCCPTSVTQRLKTNWITLATLVAILTLVATGNMASEPTTHPSDAYGPLPQAYFIRATDDLRPKLMDLLGENPIDEAEIKVRLAGNRKRVQLDTSVGVRYRAAYDENDHPLRGFIVELLPDRPTTTGPVGAGHRRLAGTIKLYVPGKAAAVDFEAEVFPAGELTDADPTVLATDGRITWKNLRPIPYTAKIWSEKAEEAKKGVS